MLGESGVNYPEIGTVLDLIPASLGDTFLSWVDAIGDGEMVVSAPRDRQLRPVTLALGEQVEVVWRGPSGLRGLPAVLAEIEWGEQPRWHLRGAGAVTRGQRRDAVRAPLSVPVRIGPEPSPISATSVDLSEGGLRCVLEKRSARGADAPALEVGDVVRMSALLPDLTLTCLSEIARRHPRDDARVELSLRFIGLPEHERDLVRRRVFARLRDLRRRGLL